MSNLFTSDLHLGHRNIFTYRDIFATAKDHDDYMIDKILSLKKRDILYVLGDFIFDGPHYDEYIKMLRKKTCRIKLIMGNHDSLRLYSEDIFELQLPLFSYKNNWISHCPIHSQEMRGRDMNIHGHLHKEILHNPMYRNVNIDVNNYEFLDFDNIKSDHEEYLKNISASLGDFNEK